MLSICDAGGASTRLFKWVRSPVSDQPQAGGQAFPYIWFTFLTHPALRAPLSRGDLFNPNGFPPRRTGVSSFLVVLLARLPREGQRSASGWRGPSRYDMGTALHFILTSSPCVLQNGFPPQSAISLRLADRRSLIFSIRQIYFRHAEDLSPT